MRFSSLVVNSGGASRARVRELGFPARVVIDDGGTRCARVEEYRLPASVVGYPSDPGGVRVEDVEGTAVDHRADNRTNGARVAQLKFACRDGGASGIGIGAGQGQGSRTDLDQCATSATGRPSVSDGPADFGAQIVLRPEVPAELVLKNWVFPSSFSMKEPPAVLTPWKLNVAILSKVEKVGRA